MFCCETWFKNVCAISFFFWCHYLTEEVILIDMVPLKRHYRASQKYIIGVQENLHFYLLINILWHSYEADFNDEYLRFGVRKTRIGTSAISFNASSGENPALATHTKFRSFPSWVVFKIPRDLIMLTGDGRCSKDSVSWLLFLKRMWSVFLPKRFIF